MTLHRRPEAIWLWRETRPFVPFQIGSVILILTASAISLTQPLIMKWLIDDVLPNRRWGTLLLVSSIFLAAATVRAALTSIAAVFTAKAMTRTMHRIRVRLMKRICSFSPALHTRYTTGDLLQRMEQDVMIVGEAGSEVMPSIARVLGETAMAVGIMFYLDWRLSAIVLPLLPMLAYVRNRTHGQLRGGSEAVREAHARQSSLLQEAFNGLNQIQLLGAERRVTRDYTRLSLKTSQREIALKNSELVFSVLSMSIIGLGIAGIIQYGGMRVLFGGLSIGGLVAFYGYIGSILTPLGMATQLYGQVIRVGVSIRRLMEIEQAHDVIQEAPDAAPLPTAPRTLVCTNVSLAYDAGHEVLRRIDFRARVGERVAIVGLSGSGKSSLLKLIPRLYDAKEGRVEVDGRDVRSLQIESLRRAISFVPQDPVLFQGTLRANVRYGCRTATTDEIEYAAWLACLTDVVKRMPQGWDTELGPSGSGLSGGERQRVALARALLQQRPILILDEAASALDGATEHLMLSRLDEWSTDRIVIVVSHRPAAARWADRVVVLNRGEVVEEDSHDVLSRSGTHYGTLWESHEPTAAR